jgi:hypothetical protein
VPGPRTSAANVARQTKPSSDGIVSFTPGPPWGSPALAPQGGCQNPNLPRECHLGWTFKGPCALRPLRPGATTNPERWLWTSLLTLKESASSGGPPDFREFPKSIAIRRVNSSRPPPAKSKEKPARLGRRVRVLPLVVSSNHLAESVALPPIRGKASCPNLKAFCPPFHSLQLRAPLVRSARPG